MKVKIDVTQDRINRGKKKSVCSCPIALALKETLGIEKVRVEGGNNILIGSQTWLSDRPLYSVGLCVSSELGRYIDDFIYNFDSKEEVKPFSFTLDLI